MEDGLDCRVIARLEKISPLYGLLVVAFEKDVVASILPLDDGVGDTDGCPLGPLVSRLDYWIWSQVVPLQPWTLDGHIQEYGLPLQC